MSAPSLITRFNLRSVAVLALVGSLLSCRAAQVAQKPVAAESPLGRLDDARRHAAAAPESAEAQVTLGFLEYLIASDPDAALKSFARAQMAHDASAQEQRALALAGTAEILEDRLQSVAAAGSYAEALRAAPSSPIAELAAERLLALEGDSRAVDDVVLEIAKWLHAGVEGRAAHLIREAAAHVAISRNGSSPAPQESELWAAAGAVQRWRVAGPFAAERLLDLDQPTVLDSPQLSRAPERGPAGSTAERTLEFPDGDVGLDLEPSEGDLYYGASELVVARGGDYLLMVEGAGALEARLDGMVAIARSPWPREEPRAQTQSVRLAPGRHALLVRWSRAEGPRFRISLARVDGAASDLVSSAPEHLAGQRLASPCRLGIACVPPPAFVDARGLRGAAEARLSQNPEDVVAAFLLVRATLKDDRDAARGAIERLIALTGSGAPALTLRVAQVLGDADVPERIGHAQALSDLSAALEKDPRMLRAALTQGALQRDAERMDEAAAALSRAERSARAMLEQDAPLPARLLVARARLLEMQGNTALARTRAQAARQRDGGRCDALGLSQELSRREGSLVEQMRLADALVECPDLRPALPMMLRERGDLPAAEALLARFAAQRPAQPQRLAQLAELQAARGNIGQAVETLRHAVDLAPRASDPWRQIAAFLDLAGDAKGALEARTMALSRLPGDLQLRHQVALARGEKLMAWSDRDGLALAHRAASTFPESETSARPAALRLLDYGGVEFAADGTAIERVHTLVRLLDKNGIAKFGEVQIPADAELLELRTIKPDGRVLEPEQIAEKDAHSLPGLAPGDLIETDYLRSYAARGPELPGSAPGAFYFVDDDTPMLESTYEVHGAKGVPLEVDAHHLAVQPIETTSEGLRFSHTARSIAPVHPEPNQPGEEEIAPWVQVGFGARPEAVARSIADWVLMRARPTVATDALASRASGATVREKVDKIVAAVSGAVRGRINAADFALPAQLVLALGRGNRLLVIKAALASAGVSSHLALVKPFGAMAESVRFPRGDLYSFAVLRIDAQPGLVAPIWLDASWRLGPIDQLPPFARGQPALILPEPGEAAQLLQTPSDAHDGDDGRLLSFDLKLSAAGEALGTARDEVHGFEAAALREALEQLDGQARRQAIEQMLARAIAGATLDTLSVEGENAQGGPASLGYGLHAPLGRLDGAGLRVPASLSAAHLERHYADRGERKKTLLLQLLEKLSVQASIALPAGFHLVRAPEPVELSSPFGRYRWSAREEAGRMLISEELSMPPQRISPADYPAFVAFVREVDQVQGAELLVEPARR